ncbi:hypothetical protein GLYMA_10G049000v4 [Glycine max]|uniref:Uncharacterized protein n=1 Tax=Glycine max TaxID=3847 RepID=K7LHH4_SOYBN|nr:hypothetical protein JHK87_026837 [Glycine soja]KAG4996142.1 hypothetical protein JHK85_027581 [Glycine max]KAG5150715.1 hypothetical protein JHK84_027187 [Glycine max]KAH1136806.1 hypothetical protein GYH30_026999 [Glycine max]KHN39112.1 hypothetical protein glysoja_017406 [Glycine soja]
MCPWYNECILCYVNTTCGDVGSCDQILFIKTYIYLWKRIIIHKLYCKFWNNACLIPSIVLVTILCT